MSHPGKKIRNGGAFFWASAACVVFVISACSPTYPYLVTNDTCHCEEYTYHDRSRKIKVTIRASYKVTERIHSTIELTFRNGGTDTLDLGQAYVRGTSENVRYQYNGKSLPLPYVQIEPGDEYTITLGGSDTEVVEDPWRRIAGERVIIEIMKLRTGNITVPNVVFVLVPVNPKFSS
ncbi:MAG: hypothetical protein HY562_08935 [Ignavibacteriales bacterium]|nr:hypothetical protein [Ignavibacteriales bacterium]